jgi:hypothetical protein
MNRTSSIIRLSQALAAAALLPALAGCEERATVDGQLGELGRLEFTYTRSCFFGCLIDQPLLAGTREAIKLEGDGAAQPNLSVHAEDEDVAQVALDRQCYCEREDTTGRLDVALDGRCEEPWHMVCENKILIEAGLEPGRTLVEVRDDSDQLLDRVTVRVEDADRARFFGTLPDELGERAGDKFTLPAQSRLELRLELYDEDGIELLAPEGVTWRVSDASVATLNAFLIGAGEEVSAGRDMVVETHAAGEASVEIDVPGLKAAIDVEVE